MSPSNVQYKRLFALLPPGEGDKLVKEINYSTHDNFIRGAFSPELHAALFNLLKNTDRDHRKIKADAGGSPDDTYFSDDVKTPLSRLRLVLNLRNRRKSFLYDPATDEQFDDYDFEKLVEPRIRYLLGPAYESWLESNSKDCLISYRPGSPRFFRDPGGLSSTHYNLWREAPWRTGWAPDSTVTTMPPFFASSSKLSSRTRRAARPS